MYQFTALAVVSMLVGVSNPEDLELRRAQYQHRQAWHQRQAQFKGLSYEGKGRELVWSYDERGVGKTKTREVQWTVRMLPAQLAWRMDLQRNPNGDATLVLDKSGLHFVKNERGGNDAGNSDTTALTIMHETQFQLGMDYSYPLPFLLAHGIVPIPPTSHNAMVSAVRRTTKGSDRTLVVDRLRSVAFGDGTVEVETNRNGSVKQFAAELEDGGRVDIRMEYNDESSLLQGCTLLVFGQNQKMLRRVDLQITKASSALSHLYFRVERLQFPTDVADSHLPVHAALRGVHVV